jgi:hypothetical protein
MRSRKLCLRVILHFLTNICIGWFYLKNQFLVLFKFVLFRYWLNPVSLDLKYYKFWNTSMKQYRELWTIWWNLLKYRIAMICSGRLAIKKCKKKYIYIYWNKDLDNEQGEPCKRIVEMGARSDTWWASRIIRVWIDFPRLCHELGNRKWNTAVEIWHSKMMCGFISVT